MTAQSDPDLIAYLNEVLRTIKPEQQNNTFWFPTPENPGQSEDDTPIQTRILKELNELKQDEKLNPQKGRECRTKIRKRFDWTYTHVTETEMHAMGNNADIGINTEFKVKLTLEDNKVVYSQNPPNPIYLKKSQIVELTLMHKYGIITKLPFSKYSSPIIAQRKPNGKLRLLVDLRKIKESDCG